MPDRWFLKISVALCLATAFVFPAYAQRGDESALPRLTFPMPAVEYPQEALVANQEGTTVLRLTIGSDGAMLDVQVEETSGYSILDNAAILIARNAKLSEPPRAPDGQPTTAQALADAI